MVHLTNLPLEILHNICANLCHHCTGQPVNRLSPQPVEPGQPPVEQHTSCFKGAMAFSLNKTKIRTAALYAMILTCKSLRDIAQPYLYHHPCARAPAVSKLLLRSLTERPDLAHYINQLSVFDMECQSLEGMLRLMLRVPEFRDRREYATQLHTRDCHGYHNPPIPGKHIKFVDIKYDFATAFTAIVLPFGTGLQILHLELDYDRKLPSCEPGSLPRLKELVVKNREREPIGLTIIASIFIAAPALERLGALDFFCGADWQTPRPPIHEGVKEIWLERCMVNDEGLAALAGLFPSLQAFTYEANDDLSSDDRASICEIGKALQVCQDLRFLSLDFTNGSREGEVDPTDQLGDLAKLEKLQKFRVKRLSVFREMPPWMDTPLPGPPIKISDMLPTSITEFEVTRPGTNIFDDMLELSRVAGQRFALLKHVSMNGIEQEWEEYDRFGDRACMGLERINELRQAFRQSGIELSTGDFGKFLGFSDLI